MTVFFAGGEAAGLTPTANCVEITTGGTFDSTYARLALGFVVPSAGASDYWSAKLIDPSTQAFTNQTTVWFHGEFFTPNASSTGAVALEAVNNSGTVVFKIARDASGNYQASYWNGSTYVNVGSAVSSMFTQTRYKIDIKLVCGASGSMEFYLNNILATSGSIGSSSCDNVAEFRLKSGFSSSANAAWSQIIVTDENTVNWHLYTKAPTANGANTAWTGVYTDVNEAVNNDATFIESTSAGDIETDTGAALTITGFSVKAVVVGLRGKLIASGPQNVQAALRISSTNYFTSNLAGLGSGFAGQIGIFPTDPSTSAAWGITNAAAATTEFGLKSAA